MDPELRKRLQIVMILAIVLAAARAAFIFYSRIDTASEKPQAPSYHLTDDDYVTPSKIFPYDLKSAQKELAGKTVWVRNGNAVPYYGYSPTAGSVDLSRKIGLLAPLEKLQVEDVVLQRESAPLMPGQVTVVHKRIMVVFRHSGQPGSFASAIGNNIGNDFDFTANEEFFFEDPHVLYKHWPQDVWNAIDQHQAKTGMNELQVSFALGSMAAATPGPYGSRTAQYRTRSGLVKVAFEKNRAIEIEQENAK